MPTGAELWNDPEYSDLALRLSDGREIKVHKIIICKRNKYFDSLCGSSSRFAEAKKSVIELKDDNADAVEEVLRKIYGCKLPYTDDKSWRFWLDLVVTADKYLEERLSMRAEEILREIAQKTRNVDMLVDIIMAIEDDLSHCEPLLVFANVLRMERLLELHNNKRYRDSLFENRDLLELHFDELSKRMVAKKDLCKDCKRQPGI